ncbi:MAG TPA: N-acetylglucosamine-6-phosphate deacetylase [Chitinophaga sp.]|uniref:N-acetylglucosamine-6-phosphate deacetylase n=1 Tax=Chitinophaga sp. TaxID=1869181 RepID=UPI002C97E73B|nr:N-acetylglucosamine-6-phosphate deacetylase [Chitinophaga sp.]HVI43688.1 N-acetylglucosamine-6-phosphate deacetylase [Chitinophaga sp.]
MKTLKIFNGHVITPHRIIRNATVLIRDGVITEVTAGDLDAPDAETLDAGGHYIAPGFIDLHVHGGGGHDFMDGNVASFLRIAELHARYGTTAMYPTTLTSEPEYLFKTLDYYEAAVKQNSKGAQLLGMHLEGPYFAMSQRGAQDPRYIRDPDPEEYEAVLAYSSAISRWSAAPELKGAIAFGRYLRSRGVLAAVAHTDAIYEEVLEAYENGYTLATHFYSAMSGVTRRNAFRYAGVIESGYLIDEMDVEIIADGIHLPPPLLKLVYKIKGPDRTALITDAMRAAGMPPGESILGNIHHGTRVIVEDGVAKLPDRSSFAGSVATADRLVRTMIQQADVPLAEAVRMITATPARIMGIADKKGVLVAGKDADIVIFDENIHIQQTIIGGTIVHDIRSSL